MRGKTVKPIINFFSKLVLLLFYKHQKIIFIFYFNTFRNDDFLENENVH